MRRTLLLLVVALAWAGSARAETVMPLPFPPSVFPKTPPLAPESGASSLPPLQPQFIGRLTSREWIVVGVDRQGAPQTLRVLQRIEIDQLGDYVFAVPAPVRSVAPGPGTQSPPGQRENQILWEGFSPGRRVLAAWADLRVAESAGSLPLLVEIEDGAIVFQNATGTTARSYTADVEPRSLMRALGRLRDAVRRDVFAEGLDVRLNGPPRPERERVVVPLRVEGEIRLGSEVMPVSTVVGDSPVRLALPGGGPPRLDLEVIPVRLGAEVSARSLRAYTGDRRRLLARAIELELRYGRERQYDMFLANPDPGGPSEATYVYRTVSAVPAPGAGAGEPDGDLLALILVGIGLAIAIPVGAVVWAHM